MKKKQQLQRGDFTELIPIIDELLKKKAEDTVIIAIDGRCGSGKSTLGSLLCNHYRGNLFHMDDFYLPMEIREEKRLKEAGGNVHYERFYEEIIHPLAHKKNINYRRYSCSQGCFLPGIELSYKPLNIIEGSYCHHYSLSKNYSLKVFLTTTYEKQKERIGKRNGALALQSFIQRWIPLEELYFKEMKIEEEADIIIST